MSPRRATNDANVRPTLSQQRRPDAPVAWRSTGLRRRTDFAATRDVAASCDEHPAGKQEFVSFFTNSAEFLLPGQLLSTHPFTLSPRGDKPPTIAPHWSIGPADPLFLCILMGPRSARNVGYTGTASEPIARRLRCGGAAVDSRASRLWLTPSLGRTWNNSSAAIRRRGEWPRPAGAAGGWETAVCSGRPRASPATPCWSGS